MNLNIKQAKGQPKMEAVDFVESKVRENCFGAFQLLLEIENICAKKNDAQWFAIESTKLRSST